ncbi:tetraacyldisaccharide 4'-kinase [Legionella geestiana]|uniref:tetraacyldisaccharide 4'-kinase n=1 Tax=Legionella geestiana TaxID=45065 RepID=UPI0010920092|nr:tetraacyldisaccharide 4'-kinase [Legionella geestiana]QDQ40660.1 tetraacyldisaccharide 4'-kinase [Legionella geestiana]
MKPSLVDALWYTRHPARWLLWPFSLVYRMIVCARRAFLCRFRQTVFPLPVIVVGNLTVGGAGKTPLVAALARYFSERGFKVGIVSRGYGANPPAFPYRVLPEDTAAVSGDEPLLLAQKTGCPVVIDPQRVRAVEYLLKTERVNLVLSDDGLQHYALGRTLEIAVIDGQRGPGNGMCLPAGPLREPAGRLRSVDMVVVNGGVRPGAYTMTLEARELRRLTDNISMPVNALSQPVAAVAGTGNPGRFFETLSALGIAHHPYPFPDHHPFEARDLAFSEPTVLMTEKDAVKCQPFATETMYCLPVEATLSPDFWEALCRALRIN